MGLEAEVSGQQRSQTEPGFTGASGTKRLLLSTHLDGKIMQVKNGELELGHPERWIVKTEKDGQAQIKAVKKKDVIDIADMDLGVTDGWAYVHVTSQENSSRPVIHVEPLQGARGIQLEYVDARKAFLDVSARTWDEQREKEVRLMSPQRKKLKAYISAIESEGTPWDESALEKFDLKQKLKTMLSILYTGINYSRLQHDRKVYRRTRKLPLDFDRLKESVEKYSIKEFSEPDHKKFAEMHNHFEKLTNDRAIKLPNIASQLEEYAKIGGRFFTLVREDKPRFSYIVNMNGDSPMVHTIGTTYSSLRLKGLLIGYAGMLIHVMGEYDTEVGMHVPDKDIRITRKLLRTIS